MVLHQTLNHHLLVVVVLEEVDHLMKFLPKTKRISKKDYTDVTKTSNDTKNRIAN